jgi:hypothetical protein
MGELRGKGEPVYPTTLDVINYGGNEYQVIASGQSRDSSRDLFVLKDVVTGEVIRVKGAVFTPFKVTRNPGPGDDVHLRDEGVRVTGSIAGGEIE